MRKCNKKLAILAGLLGSCLSFEGTAARTLGPGEAGGPTVDRVTPTARAAVQFGGSADMSPNEVAKLFATFGLEKEDFPLHQFDPAKIGFAVYDTRQQRYVRSYNLDRSFDLASTTKLFTMSVVGKVFAADDVLQQRRQELAAMLFHSRNQGASLWLLLAQQRQNGHKTNPAAMISRVTACYATGRDGREHSRSDQQRQEELTAATTFFAQHRVSYDIDWTNASIVDGAGCERAGTFRGGEDRMSPRQYLTVLDSLRQQQFGGWDAYDIMPKTTLDGIKGDENVSPQEAIDQNRVAWKTGTDYAGVKNIAGYIPSNGDKFAFYYVMFINTGLSGSEGVKNGGTLPYNFASWAAKMARNTSAAN